MLVIVKVANTLKFMVNQTGKEVVKMYARTYLVCLLTAFVLGAFCQWAYMINPF